MCLCVLLPLRSCDLVGCNPLVQTQPLNVVILGHSSFLGYHPYSFQLGHLCWLMGRFDSCLVWLHILQNIKKVFFHLVFLSDFFRFFLQITFRFFKCLRYLTATFILHQQLIINTIIYYYYHYLKIGRMIFSFRNITVTC